MIDKRNRFVPYRDHRYSATTTSMGTGARTNNKSRAATFDHLYGSSNHADTVFPMANVLRGLMLQDPDRSEQLEVRDSQAS